MVLSAPVPREAIHSREIECRGYRRSDGLWDIEARLLDTKTYDFDNRWRGTVSAGTPVHEMWVRLTLDEDFRIHGAEASSDHNPFPACASAAPRMSALEGQQIGPGWQLALRNELGGAQGCTHLFELLGPLATTAFQTIMPLRRKRAEPAGQPRAKPRVIDSCLALVSDGEVVREEWPEFYTGP